MVWRSLFAFVAIDLSLVFIVRTMESLHREKKKRESELVVLRNSEPQITTELAKLREEMSRMKAEIKV